MASAALIGVDWGTSSVRAYRIAFDGVVIDSRESTSGVQKMGRVSYASALDTLLGDWRDEPVPRLAAGMVGSRNGWIEVPYVEAPATLRALADGLRRTPDGELAIVPGVIVRDSAGTPDVIRGEETQLFGALDEAHADTLLVMPGTHSKWVVARDGTLAEFATWMTGELYAVLLAHSILGRLAEPGTGGDDRGFQRGVEFGLRDGAIVHDCFAARSLVLTGELAGADVADFLSGLLIGREVRDGERWTRKRGNVVNDVCVVGADALATRYGYALAQAGIVARRAPFAAARGLWRIARAASLLSPRSP
ncbi:MAG: 2-dehydro-3-deoxygalactonokinase [Casimicrobiaceae bacterium]